MKDQIAEKSPVSDLRLLLGELLWRCTKPGDPIKGASHVDLVTAADVVGAKHELTESGQLKLAVTAHYPSFVSQVENVYFINEQGLIDSHEVSLVKKDGKMPLSVSVFTYNQGRLAEKKWFNKTSDGQDQLLSHLIYEYAEGQPDNQFQTKKWGWTAPFGGR